CAAAFLQPTPLFDASSITTTPNGICSVVSVETREVYSSPDFAPSGSMPTNATGYAVETEVCGMACSLLGGLRDGARRAPSVAVRFDHVGAGLVGLRLLDGEGVGVQMVARDDVVGSAERVRARGRALD